MLMTGLLEQFYIIYRVDLFLCLFIFSSVGRFICITVFLTRLDHFQVMDN